VVCFDPLDGSSNIDCLISIGTIFSIYKKVIYRLTIYHNMCMITNTLDRHYNAHRYSADSVIVLTKKLDSIFWGGLHFIRCSSQFNWVK